MFDPAVVEGAFRLDPGGRAAVSDRGMVSAAFPEATDAGVAMLEAGGNAADAACAAALALCVCEPQACGVGGHSVVLAHIDGSTFTLDGLGPVPRSYPDRTGRPVEPNGYRGTTVPTTIATLGYLHREWGRLPWRKIVEPSVTLAREGYRITELQRALQIRELPDFSSVPSGSGSRYFLKAPGEAFGVGDLFRQQELARLLEIVGEEGPEAFYEGPIAAAIDADMQEHSGFLCAEDLAEIPWPVVRGVVGTDYRGVRVLSGPPPMGGRMLVFVLKALRTLPPDIVSAAEWPTWRFLADLFRTALTYRHRPPMTPDGYEQENDPLLADERLIRTVADVLWHGGRFPGDAAWPPDPQSGVGETTHLSVLDAEGNAVGITQSVNMVYGSKAAAESLGFLYNNYLLDTEPLDEAHPHYLKPGNKPWSSACPTLVMVDGRPWLLTGSPGSDRIITTVAQFLVHVIDGGCGLEEAVERPRLHCTATGEVSLEASRFPPGTAEAFESAGYVVTRREPYAFHHGAIHAVLREIGGRRYQGMAEVRRDGKARGP